MANNKPTHRFGAAEHAKRASPATAGQPRWQLPVFLLIFALLTVYLTGVLESKSGTINGFYEEPKDSIDVIYLGGSHANAAFNPMALYGEYGYTGYVLYSWAQPMWTSYHYLVEALKTQHPKVVVLDAFGMAYGNTYISTNDTDATSDDFSLLIRPGLNRARLALAMSRCQAEHKSVTRYLSYINYHNRWKTLTVEDWLWPLEPLRQTQRTTGKGYGPIYTTESYPQQLAPAVGTTTPAEIYPPCLDYLSRIQALCQSSGAQLVLTVAPYLVESDTEYDLFRQVGSWCEANGVPYLNYLENENADRIGFDYAADLGDHGHVNTAGSAKITADVGAFLAEHTSLPDHRTDAAFARWAQDLAAEQRDAEKMELRLETAPDAVLAQALAPDGGYVTVVAVRGDLSSGAAAAPEAGQTMDAALLAHGITGENGESLTRQSEAAALYVFEDGVAICQQKSAGAPFSYSGADGRPLFTASCTAQAACVELAADGSELCRNCPGVNVVVFDKATGARVQSIAFVATDGFAAYTG